MEPINDYYRYTQLMRNGFYDKLFFIDKLFDPWYTLLDYGCADGFQTKILAQIFPDKKIIGYDSDADMLNRAAYTGSMPGNVRFTNDIDTEADTIYLSSVIHEVYSYSKPERIEDFWRMVFHNRDRVIIRDMGLSGHWPKERAVFMKKAVPIVRQWSEARHVRGELQRFEERFGSINTDDNLIHFLLKFLYVESPNWHREVHENYLPVTSEQIIALMPEGWHIDYRENYTLPYLKWKWRTEFGLDVPYTTHYKLILSRR